MYSFCTENKFVSRLIVTLGNITSRSFIVVMILAAFVLPAQTRGQRDADIEDPAPSSDGILHGGIVLLDDVEEHQIDIKRMDIAGLTQGVAAGMLSNKIDPSTIVSYSKGGGRGSILCSTIARINLNMLTDLPYEQNGFGENVIPRGDAYDLTLRGIRQDQLLVSSQATLESDIMNQYNMTHNTIYDIYFYKASNNGVMQGHRVAAFVGTDDRVYILDPIRGHITSKPQSVSDHFEADPYKGYSVYISKNSYRPLDKYKTITEYYHATEGVKVSHLVHDGIASIETVPLSKDVVVTLNHPLTVTADGNDIILHKGSKIVVNQSQTMLSWKLVGEQGKIVARPTQPQLSLGILSH